MARLKQPSAEQTGAGSLKSVAQRQILSRFCDALKGKKPKATYAFGGNVRVITEHCEPNDIPSKEQGKAASAVRKAGLTVSLPIVLHWRSTEDSSLISELRLPSGPEASPALDRLVKDCNGTAKVDGATENITTSQLDAIELTTNFCPYKTGIIDVVAQLFLPSLARYGLPLPGIRAELTALRVLFPNPVQPLSVAKIVIDLQPNVCPSLLTPSSTASE